MVMVEGSLCSIFVFVDIDKISITNDSSDKSEEAISGPDVSSSRGQRSSRFRRGVMGWVHAPWGIEEGTENLSPKSLNSINSLLDSWWGEGAGRGGAWPGGVAGGGAWPIDGRRRWAWRGCGGGGRTRCGAQDVLRVPSSRCRVEVRDGAAHAVPSSDVPAMYQHGTYPPPDYNPPWPYPPHKINAYNNVQHYSLDDMQGVGHTAGIRKYLIAIDIDEQIVINASALGRHLQRRVEETVKLDSAHFEGVVLEKATPTMPLKMALNVHFPLARPRRGLNFSDAKISRIYDAGRWTRNCKTGRPCLAKNPMIITANLDEFPKSRDCPGDRLETEEQDVVAIFSLSDCG
ncbi:hypothetical protein AAG570_012866 [Ranatra chinensis]|uniref:Uncharacterized protein n=1 Tax=Ranatra chinensis TaxID=642074 RepID=A0ABD0YTR3_9HEMI